MNRRAENNIYLDWNFPGSWEAVISNGKISQVSFMEPGKGDNEGLTSIDPIYLRNIHQALGELFKEEEEQQKSLGYSFAKTDEK